MVILIGRLNIGRFFTSPFEPQFAYIYSQFTLRKSFPGACVKSGWSSLIEPNRGTGLKTLNPGLHTGRAGLPINRAFFRSIQVYGNRWKNDGGRLDIDYRSYL